MSDVAISDFLASLGLSGAAADEARAVLESEGITNPRKTRLSDAKLERARNAIDARFARFCASCAPEADTSGRPLVTVSRTDCTRCRGSRNERALLDLSAACEAAGLRRLVVVGGSPDTRRELSSVRGSVELRLIDGTARRTRPEAQRDLDWADLVVIAGSSELNHKVSDLYTRSRSPHVITAPRRGVEAIAGVILEHVARRSARN